MKFGEDIFCLVLTPGREAKKKWDLNIHILIYIVSVTLLMMYKYTDDIAKMKKT